MLVIAHRGAPSLAPENTLASFERAIQIGVDGIELDVHLSADGHLVVIHDENLARTTDGTGLVHEKPLAELRQLSAGAGFGAGFADQRIPTLEETLALVAGRVPLQVEIKGKTRGVTEATVDLLRRRGVLADCLLTSFHLDLLPEARALAPEAAIGALVWGRSRDGRQLSVAECVAATRAAQAEVMLLWHEWASAAMVAAGTAAGLAVGAAAGTASAAGLRRLLGLGLVRATSNYPDLARAVLAAG